jgi:hypothetical protein
MYIRKKTLEVLTSFWQQKASGALTFKASFWQQNAGWRPTATCYTDPQATFQFTTDGLIDANHISILSPDPATVGVLSGLPFLP